MNQEEQKITAYALGELQGAEKEQFEQELKDNSALQREIEEIRNLTGALEVELKEEVCPQLEGEQRDKVMASAVKKKSPVMFYLSTAAAAALAVGIYVLAKPNPLASSEDAKAATELTEKNNRVAESKVSAPVVNMPEETAVSDYDKNSSPSAPIIAIDEKTEIYLNRAEEDKAKRIAQAETRLVKAKKDYEYADKKVLEIRGRMPAPKPGQIIAPVEGTTERYGKYTENAFGIVSKEPLSTFSIDVDTASYANLRRKVLNGYLPHKDAVRVEEMINYFDYDYPQPEQGRPFSVNLEMADCPWTKGNKLVRIGLHGKDVKVDERPSSNLVFLIDVSGSMSSSDKLPLLKEGFQKMVSQLNEKDRVGIVVYASNAGVVLEPTVCDEKGRDQIIGALGRLNSGGSTNGAGGIKQAYKLVEDNFIQGGTNRVILATDGDFNVGVSSNSGLINLVKEKAKKRAYLTVLGFGQGNLNDHMMEEISNKGNGNYFYIDSAKESTRVLCQKISSTLVTIAKDVKIQVEFNPGLVHSYRLVGYDNRRLNKEDFNDDKKDAGEIGAGHNVTAIYEVVPVGSSNAKPLVDDLKYQPEKVASVEEKPVVFGDELLTVKLRYKSPEGGPSTLTKYPLKKKDCEFNNASKDFIFSTSVAAFGMLLKESKYCGDISFEDIEGWIAGNNTLQENEERKELLNLVRAAGKLKNGN